MDWFFDGLGTFLIGLLFGGASGSAVTWRVINTTKVKQSQRAGDRASQTQVGGNQATRRRDKG